MVVDLEIHKEHIVIGHKQGMNVFLSADNNQRCGWDFIHKSPTLLKGTIDAILDFVLVENFFSPKIGPPRPSPLERSYLVFQIRSRLVFGGLGLLSPTECCEEDGLPDVARCYFHLSVHPGHEAASTTQLLTPTPPSPA